MHQQASFAAHPAFFFDIHHSPFHFLSHLTVDIELQAKMLCNLDEKSLPI